MSAIKFGVMSGYKADYAEDNLELLFKNASSLGVKSVMISLLATDKIKEDLLHRVDEIKEYMKKYDVEINAIWARWSPPHIWNFYDGPNAIGLIPFSIGKKGSEKFLTHLKLQLLGELNTSSHIADIFLKIQMIQFILHSLQ